MFIELGANELVIETKVRVLKVKYKERENELVELIPKNVLRSIFKLYTLKRFFFQAEDGKRD